MAQFKLEFTVTRKGLRGEQIRAVALETLKNVLEEKLNATVSFSFKKVNLEPSRAERLSEANDLKSDAFSIVSELAEEMQNWLDNLPENLRSSDKASQIEDAQSNLQQAADDLENIDLDGIEFPSAF